MCNFAIQVANRFFENFTVEIGIDTSYNQLMDLGEELDTCEIDDEYELNNTHGSNNVMLNYHTESLQRIGEYIGHGKYNLSFEMCELDEVNYSIRWNDYHLRKLHDELLFAVHAYSVLQKWTRKVSITGFTSITKYDVTTRKDNMYRSDTCFYDEK